MTGCDWKIMSHLILIDLWKSTAQVDFIEFAQGSFKSQLKTESLYYGLEISIWVLSRLPLKRIFGL